MICVLSCPHCNDSIIIESINCGIFRHGVFKENGLQINPHSTKIECDTYVENDLIYGCGKPFKIVNIEGLWKSEICDYI